MAPNVKRSGLGIVLSNPSGENLRQAIRTVPLTNNEAKYEALIAGLELAQGLYSEVIEIKCDSQLVCYAPLVHQPEKPLHSVLSPWTFMMLGMDIVRSQPPAPGAYQKIGEREVDHIITISSEHKRSSRINKKVIIQKLKRRLEAAKGKWPGELSGVLWVYRTMAALSSGETPFSLVYGAEALILVELGEPTLRYFWANKEANNEVMLVNLELLDECRDLAHIMMASQKQIIERYCNRRANLRCFKVGDLVLRKVTQNTGELNAGKIGPTSEGPYWVSTVTGKGSYDLENQDGEKFPNNWNVAHLKIYYC
uniref:Uncharacterized protein LOC104211216 n=1 Tax=Nicotiana sylvestris TaxID=4096 RepID=A0A1U7UR12_NICSY|nr:PREDICTED: uncharacterized protein LOC104211216 [Nicotiana sylvestris]